MIVVDFPLAQHLKQIWYTFHPLTWVYVLFLLISVLHLILYPIKNMSLRHWCHCELLLEWSVGMSYYHISVYVAVLMVKSPALNSWWSNVWCFRFTVVLTTSKILLAIIQLVSLRQTIKTQFIIKYQSFYRTVITF